MKNMAFWEYRPQTLAILPDACILLTSGMNLAFGLGYSYDAIWTHFRYSWFIGAIGGIILSALLTKYFLKRYFALHSSLIVIVAGILCIVWPYYDETVVAARYLNGIGTGLIIVPFIVHCSETIVTRKRGYALGFEQLFIAIGIFIQVTFTTLWKGYYKISPICMHGIFCLAFGLIALAFTPTIIESPIFYIRHDNDAAALFALTRLELPAVLSAEKKELLEQHKSYVLQNEFDGFGGSFRRGLVPLIKMLLYRGVLALTFSLPYNRMVINGSNYDIYSDFQWPIIAYTVLRLLGVIGGMTMADTIGRKIIGVISLLPLAGVSIGVALCVDQLDEFTVAWVLLVLMQFFAGLYAPTSTIYLGEAFPMLVKPFFIGLCICLEYAMHIIMIFIFRYNSNAIYGFDIFNYTYLLICFVLCLLTVPETKLLTLQKAQQSFSDWINYQF